MVPFYLLIRTSERPTFFKNCMESVKRQTYGNIITIVHSDTPTDDYVEGDIILHSERYSQIRRDGKFNLYCNKMLDAIPDGPGWYMFLDDDDKLHNETVIEDVIPNLLEDRLNGPKIIWWDYYHPERQMLFPDFVDVKPQISLPTASFIIHTKHKDKERFWDRTMGDYNYTMKLGMPVHWIDLIVQEHQFTKSYGQTEAEILKRKEQFRINNNKN
jgi:hypothetical protein